MTTYVCASTPNEALYKSAMGCTNRNTVRGAAARLRPGERVYMVTVDEIAPSTPKPEPDPWPGLIDKGAETA